MLKLLLSSNGCCCRRVSWFAASGQPCWLGIACDLRHFCQANVNSVHAACQANVNSMHAACQANVNGVHAAYEGISRSDYSGVHQPCLCGATQAMPLDEKGKGGQDQLGWRSKGGLAYVHTHLYACSHNQRTCKLLLAYFDMLNVLLCPTGCHCRESRCVPESAYG